MISSENLDKFFMLQAGRIWAARPEQVLMTNGGYGFGNRYNTLFSAAGH